MWYQIQDQQVKLIVFAKPNAKKTALIAVTENELQISLHAKPHQGEANKELISFLSELFDVPKSKIVLLRGEGGRHKQVVMPLTDWVRQRLSELKG